MSGAAPRGPGVSGAPWRVEWRVPTDGPLLLLARRAPDAAAARALALDLGERAFAGEFRLSADSGGPVVTNLAALRSWDPGAGMPPSVPRALWALELADARAVREFIHALREAVDRAAAADVLPMGDGLGLVRIASTLTAC